MEKYLSNAAEKYKKLSFKSKKDLNFSFKYYPNLQRLESLVY